MADILGLTTMLAAATALVWSGARACRIKNRFAKWSVVGLAAVVAVPVSFAAALTIAARAAALRRLADSEKPLYQSLDEAQKRRFAIAMRLAARRHLAEHHRHG